MTRLHRRSFLAVSAASLASIPALTQGQPIEQPPQRTGKPPMAVGSANALPTVARAVELMRQGRDVLEAIVAGINIVEDDPEDMSVGLGGLPNERGVVELDASCMHGPLHRAGAVAALQNIRNPASVALQVLRRTDHVLLVGQGALDFARAVGFTEENLLTDKAREAWLKWKANLNRDDDWLDDDQVIPGAEVPFTTGTIHCSGMNAGRDLAACTSTSGLSWKLPGRVGDSPIVGAGMYCDNAIGSAGATGRGEAVIQACGAFQIVQRMGQGIEPTQACLNVLKWIADHTKQKYLLDEKGRPNFDVTLYALRKDGAYGSATMRPSRGGKPRQFAVHDGTNARLEPCAVLLDV